MIGQLGIAVKDLESNSWFSSCRRLLHKFGLQKIYTLDSQIESVESWISQLKKHIDSLFKKNEWKQTDKSSFRFLNVRSLEVGKVHHSWLSVPNDTRGVKRVYHKMRLLTGSYIFQENRGHFIQNMDNTCYPLFFMGTEDRCTFLQCARGLQRADRASWTLWIQC